MVDILSSADAHGVFRARRPRTAVRPGVRADVAVLPIEVGDPHRARRAPRVDGATTRPLTHPPSTSPPGTCRRRHACPSHRENRRSAEAPSTPPRRTAPRPRPTTAARASSFEGGVARVVSGPAAPPTNSAMLTAGARRRNTPAIHPLAKAHTAKVTPSTDWWIIGRAWRSVPAAGRRERLASQEGHACGPKVCSGGRDRTSIPGSKGPCLAIRRPRRAAPSYEAAPR